MIIKKIKNRDKSVPKPVRIRELAKYILAKETEEGHEKCIYSYARGFLTDERPSQIAEMVAVALGATRSPDPVDHIVLSFKEGERPTQEQVEAQLDLLTEGLRLQGHQMFCAVHADTENLHVHVVFNRGHPETLKVIKINRGFDLEALHRVCARIEHAQGWQPEKNARYRVNREGEVVRTSSRESERGGRPSQEQIDNELRRGEKSAARIAIEIAGPIIENAPKWKDLHEELAKHGIRYCKTGSGATIQVGEVRIKASTVSKGATLAKLELRLGTCERAGEVASNSKSGESEAERGAEPDAPMDPKAAWQRIKEAGSWKSSTGHSPSSVCDTRKLVAEQRSFQVRTMNIR